MIAAPHFAGFLSMNALSDIREPLARVTAATHGGATPRSAQVLRKARTESQRLVEDPNVCAMMSRFRELEAKQSDADRRMYNVEHAASGAVPGAINARDFKALCLDLGVHRARLARSESGGVVRFAKAVKWWTSGSVAQSLQQLQYALHLFDRLDVAGKEELQFSDYSRMCRPRFQAEMLGGTAPTHVVEGLKSSLVDWKITTYLTARHATTLTRADFCAWWAIEHEIQATAAAPSPKLRAASSSSKGEGN